MNTVWVIMSNDYPDTVFDNEAAAIKYVDQRRKEDNPNYPTDVSYKRIYWRATPFVLRTEP